MTAATCPSISRKRTTLAVSVIALVPLSVLWSRWVNDSYVADTLPVQWAGNVVVATVPERPVLVVCLGAGIVGLAMAILALVPADGGFFRQRFLIVVGATVAALFSAPWWVVMVLILTSGDLRAPDEIYAPSGGVIASVLGVFAVFVAFIAGTCGSPPRFAATDPPDPGLPRVQLPVDQTVSWSRDLFGGFFLGPACAVTIVGAFVFSLSPALAILCWVMAAISVLIIRMRLTVDQRGVSLSPWAFPAAMRIRYDKIRAASAREVNPWAFGAGRSKVLPSDSGALLRRGPALVLHLADGRDLAIMMAMAEVPAGIVNSHLDALRRPSRDR